MSVLAASNITATARTVIVKSLILTTSFHRKTRGGQAPEGLAPFGMPIIPAILTLSRKNFCPADKRKMCKRLYYKGLHLYS